MIHICICNYSVDVITCIYTIHIKCFMLVPL